MNENIVAAPYEFQLGDKTFRLSPLTDRDIEELDNWLRNRIIHMARVASLTLVDSERKLILESAITVASTTSWMSPEGSKIMGTLDGIAQLTLQGLRKHHPEVTFGGIRLLLIGATEIESATTAFQQVNNSESKKKKLKDQEMKLEEKQA